MKTGIERPGGVAVAGKPNGVRRRSRRPVVYMLLCADGSLYTGVARDLEARLKEHVAGRASRYTRAHLPVELAWSRRVADWSTALRLEYRIKQLPRAAKEALLQGGRLPRG